MATGFEPCLPLNGETDVGKKAIGVIWDIAAAAFAAYNAYVAIQMAKKQEEIARRYLKISQEHRDWYNQAYVPLEDQELAEVWALEDHPAHYDAAIGRAKALGRFLFRDRLQKRVRCTSQYDTGLRGALLKDEVIAQAVALAAMAGLGFRNEQAHVDAMNDRTWKRKEQTVNRGRDQMADNVQYGKLAAGIYGDLAAQASAGASGALYFLGYSSVREETRYPGPLSFGRIPRQPGYSFPEFTGTMTGGGPATYSTDVGDFYPGTMTGGGPAVHATTAEFAFDFPATLTGGRGNQAEDMRYPPGYPVRVNTY